MIAFITVAAYPLWRTEVKEYITLQVNLRQSLAPRFSQSVQFYSWKKFYLCLKWKQELFFLCLIISFHSFTTEIFNLLNLTL